VLLGAGLALLSKAGVDVPAAAIVGVPLALACVAYFVLRTPKAPLIARTDP